MTIKGLIASVLAVPAFVIIHGEWCDADVRAFAQKLQRERIARQADNLAHERFMGRVGSETADTTPKGQTFPESR